MNKAFFLDRDGVLNKAFVKNGKPYPPATFAEFEILPGVREATRLLREAGFLLIVVTNQPDVGRKTQKKEIVETMHAFLVKELLLDDIEVCYEDDHPGNHFYKPKPGMLLRAAEKHHIDLLASFMVGDRWRDVGAGKAAGCTTIFIDRQYAESLQETPDLRCSDLLEAVLIVLRKAKPMGNLDGYVKRFKN